VAGNCSGDARRSVEGEFTGAVNSCPTPWQSLRRSTGSESRSRRCGGSAWTRGARLEGGGHRRTYRVPPRRALYGGRICLPAGLIHDDDICVTLSAIRSTRARIETAATRIAAEVVGGEMRS
jgi:hypothetical protein